MTLSKKTIVALTFFVAVVSLTVAFAVHAQVDINKICEGGGACDLGKSKPIPANTIVDLMCLIISFISVKLMPPAVVLMVLWASFLFLTAAGQPGRVMQARATLIFAILGAAILIMALPIVKLVIEAAGGSAPAQCGGAGASASMLTVFNALIGWFTWVLGIVSVVVGLYAGFLYMTSRGEPQKIALAGRVIFYAVVGVLVAISAFSITEILKGVLKP